MLPLWLLLVHLTGRVRTFFADGADIGAACQARVVHRRSALLRHRMPLRQAIERCWMAYLCCCVHHPLAKQTTQVAIVRTILALHARAQGERAAAAAAPVDSSGGGGGAKKGVTAKKQQGKKRAGAGSWAVPPSSSTFVAALWPGSSTTHQPSSPPCWMEAWLERLGKALFAKFMRGTNRRGGQAGRPSLRRRAGGLARAARQSPLCQVHLCGGVAARLADPPAFAAVMEAWLDNLLLVSSICGSSLLCRSLLSCDSLLFSSLCGTSLLCSSLLCSSLLGTQQPSLLPPPPSSLQQPLWQ